MEDIILEIFKMYGKWLDENYNEDNIYNYMKYLRENRKLHIKI